ncbi:unnamed protein product [Allacma fusca]|uniref:Uncharacterized protein n=1 Tax=Allacma fusca TaxID=39272 RepID=A0A8J2LNS9_9HEXA|nr:unnamed protein product [Allacma fusca]
MKLSLICLQVSQLLLVLWGFFVLTRADFEEYKKLDSSADDLSDFRSFFGGWSWGGLRRPYFHHRHRSYSRTWGYPPFGVGWKWNNN